MDFRGYQDGQDGLTVMAFEKEKQEVVDSIKSRLSRSKEMVDPVRRKVVVQNLQQFLKELETMEITTKLHGLWIVTDGRVQFFPVDPTFVKTWSLKSYALFPEVPLAYLQDVFLTTTPLVNAVRADRNNRFVRMEGSRYKNRETGSISLQEFSRIDTPFLLFGKNLSQKLEVPKTAMAVVPKDLTWPEVMDLFQRKERLEVHQRLSKVLEKMSHPRESSLLLYKKDIPAALEEYTIKELFVMRSRFQENDLNKNQNTSVKIHLVDPVESGDVTERFDRDLEGVIGLKYF